MPELKERLEKFLSVTLKASNTPRLLTLYVSFLCIFVRIFVYIIILK